MARVDTNVPDYSTAPILAGSTHIFTAPRAACDNCAIKSENRATLVTGTVAITPLLADYVALGKITGLDPDYVVDFLKKNLYWRAVGVSLELCIYITVVAILFAFLLTSIIPRSTTYPGIQMKLAASK